ncbi:MAG: porin [Candidatus Longimicrobiales bacterium M2_2A_002]
MSHRPLHRTATIIIPWSIILTTGALLLGAGGGACPACAVAGTVAGGRDTVEAEAEPVATLELGGALRFNAQYRDWVRTGQTTGRGSFDFDTFRLNADGTYAGLAFSAEYRIYAGYHMLHHGWVGYDFTGSLTVRAGVHKVPFGPLPYASHNWFFQLPYYVGLEDDYDAGLVMLYRQGRWDIRAAYFQNSEGSFTGSSVASARYSYDLVAATTDELGYAGLEEDRLNEEVSQLSGRVAYALPAGADATVEVGASIQTGRTRNTETDARGDHWAASLHVDGSWGRWNLIAESIRYGIDPAGPGGPSGFVVMGAYDAPYRVAGAAWMHLAGLAYTIPVRWGPISSVRLYDDYTYMAKRPADYRDSQQNVLGAAVAAGPLYVYLDVASGRNHPWLGPAYGSALAEGAAGEGWDTRLNVNIGYYF